MTCFCAVSLSDITTATSSTTKRPAWSRSSSCPCQQLPFFRGQRTGSSWYRTYLQKLVCWSKSEGAWSWRHERLADMKCARNLLFWTIFLNVDMFHQKGASSRHDHFSILGPPSTCYDSLEKICVFYTFGDSNSGETRGSKTQEDWSLRVTLSWRCRERSVGRSCEPSSYAFRVWSSLWPFTRTKCTLQTAWRTKKVTASIKAKGLHVCMDIFNCPNNFELKSGMWMWSTSERIAQKRKQCHDGRTEHCHGRERQDRWVRQRGSWYW